MSQAFGIIWRKRIHGKDRRLGFSIKILGKLAFSITCRIRAAANMSRLDMKWPMICSLSRGTCVRAALSHIRHPPRLTVAGTQGTRTDDSHFLDGYRVNPGRKSAAKARSPDGDPDAPDF